MTEVAKEHAALPFSLRNLVPALGESGARMGVVEPVKHGILRPFPVLFEKEGVSVAHFQFTVLMLAGGTLRITGLDMPDYVKSSKIRECHDFGVWRFERHEYVLLFTPDNTLLHLPVPEDLASVLATEAHTSKKAKKKAAASAAGPDAASSAADTEMSLT